MKNNKNAKMLYTVNSILPKLEENGDWDVMTTVMSQRFFGGIQDGIVSKQRDKDAKLLVAANSDSWEIKTSGYKEGSPMIHMLQKLIGVPSTGYCDRNTIIALQSFLADRNYYSGEINGILNKDTVYGWQRYLNSKM